MEEGVMPKVSCPDWFTCAEEDGSGDGVAMTEGARAGREEELVMAPVPPDGCREWVREVSTREGGELVGTLTARMMMESMGLQSIHFGFITLHGG